MDAGPPHYDEWDGLVDAAARGDVDRARVVARDLTEGPEVERGGAVGADAAARVGGALGFVQRAEPEELVDAVVTAAAACGTCHAAAGAVPVSRPPWTHATAAGWLVHGLVWNDVREPPSGAGPADEARAAWTGTDPVGDATQALTRCVGCHAAPVP